MGAIQGPGGWAGSVCIVSDGQPWRWSGRGA